MTTAEQNALSTLRSLGMELLFQDVRATSHPIYQVRETVTREYALDTDFGCPDKIVWVDQDSGEDAQGDDLELLPDDPSPGDTEVLWYDEAQEILTNEDLGEEHEVNFTAVAVGSFEYLSVAAQFFTHKAAEAYLKEYGHKLTNPEIFVASGYANPEWVAIREAAMALAQER